MASFRRVRCPTEFNLVQFPGDLVASRANVSPMDGHRRISCSVRLNAASESLAFRRYHSPDEALVWIEQLEDRLRVALDPELSARVCEVIGVKVVATVTDGDFSHDFTIIDGPLIDQKSAARIGMERFSTYVTQEFPEAARLGHRRKRTLRGARQAAYVIGAGILVALGYGLIKTLPPVFDSEAIGMRLLSVPPEFLSGTWGVGTQPDGCDSGRLAFLRGRYDVSIGGNRRQFNAKYSSVNSITARVEYVEAGITIEQTYRYSPEARTLMLVGVEASDPDIRSAIKRSLGSRFSRCD